VSALLAQARAEITMTLRRGETLLLVVGIPVVLLVFLTETKVTAAPAGQRIDFLAPGVVALCVMSTSLVALSIATGYERNYGVLRRLHVTPLGRRRLIAAKIAGVLTVELIQVVVVGSVAVVLGWRPHGSLGTDALVAFSMLLATAGLSGLGLAMAGRMRAEVNLAAANGLYLVLLLLSGFVIPLKSLPSGLARVVVALPSGALSEVLHRAFELGRSPTVVDLVSLGVWALVAPWFAARTFRFD
jgi:ABC-2 type transport system permease protein